MHARIEEELVTTQFVRDFDETVPHELYSSPYERVEVTAASLTAGTNLVAREDRRAPTARTRRRAPLVSPWALVIAALGGAGAFVLGVLAATTL